mgnify:FL=1
MFYNCLRGILRENFQHKYVKIPSPKRNGLTIEFVQVAAKRVDSNNYVSRETFKNQSFSVR